MLFRVFLALAAIAFAAPASAQSNASAPVPPHASAKSDVRPAFVGSLEGVPATFIALPPVDPAEIAAARAANARSVRKRLQVGVGREVHGHREARADALAWREIDGAHVARWEVSSPGAEALRIELATGGLAPGVELRFAGSGDPATVYGPFTAADFVAAGSTFWGPVLEGEVATVEVFVPRGVATLSTSLAITAVSHLFVRPGDEDVAAKSIGSSGSCNVNLVCESSGNAALANVGKSVAMMVFNDGLDSFQCTGTLIQSTDGSSTPYFYSAAHCLDTQAMANTLTTHWFFERTACTSGSTSPNYVQRPGGATLLFANPNSDVLLLRLNVAPPAGAWFAGWNASPVAVNAALTGVHHPSGDWKKVSWGTTPGFESPGNPLGSMIRVEWDSGSGSGVTEGGSSGSGIFSAVGSPSVPTDYQLRGGLWGGASLCTRPTSEWYDFYSRLDQAYSSIRQWIDPPVITYALTVTKPGTGTGTVASAPAGINCGATCSASFNSGTPVTLTATPSGGSTFANWGGACSGPGACIVTMDAAKSVSATFNPPPPVGVMLTVAKAGTGAGTVTSSQGGINCGLACTAEFSAGAAVTLTAAASAGSSFSGWSGACAGVAPCTVTMDVAKTVTATFAPNSSPILVHVSTAAIAFGGQSMGTTSPASPVVVTNVGANTVIFNGIVTGSSQFGQSGSCTNIAPGTSCTINATFTPAVTGIALGVSVPVNAQLSISTNAAGSPHLVALTGTAEKSLVTHYYRSILRRAPDAGGKAFWENEAQRLAGLGANVNEAWYAMAMSFYGSAEYAAFNRTNAAYVTDLYNTFFNRTPDGGGLGFWNQELVNGLPRGVALASFMFSAEFRSFSQAIFGNPTVRPEVDTVIDFYRGLLGRLPDSGGYNFWLQRFRTAQCSGQAAVLSEVEAISSAFTGSPEYIARARTNAQYVGDLYNAFLRRGGDLGGVQFWINQLVAGARTREVERRDFIASSEFAARVNAIIAAGCLS